MKPWLKPRQTIFRLALFLGVSALRCSACGLDWSVPHSHFDGVDEQGKLSWWQKIGSVDLGQGLTIPLIIGFESSNNNVSPYLGDGWTLAFLDSHMVQIDSKRFLMVQPDGWTSRFGRKDDTATLLTGQKGWLASISGNSITVWAKCGWKLVYTNGKISSISTPLNQELDYVYGPGGVVKEVDLNSSPMLTVDTDSTGVVDKLRVNGKTIAIAQGPRPFIETINCQNVVGELKPSLKQLTLMDGTTEKFKFGVDANLIPTLEISGATSRSFSWDPVSRLIASDGSWTYQIIPSKKQFSNAQISRIDAKKGSESWFHDSPNGQETTQALDGTKTTARWFTSGLLKDSIRDITQVMPTGQKNIVLSRIYSDTGRILRETETTPDGFVVKLYDNSGLLKSQSYSDKTMDIFLYDKNSRLTGIKTRSGSVVSVDVLATIENK